MDISLSALWYSPTAPHSKYYFLFPAFSVYNSIKYNNSVEIQRTSFFFQHEKTFILKPTVCSKNLAMHQFLIGARAHMVLETLKFSVFCLYMG